MSTKIAVPNSGYDAFIEPGVMDIMESLLWSDSVSIDVSSYGADFSITLWSSSSDEVIAIFDSGDNSFYGIKGWNPDITYPLVINSNVYDDDSGLKNDKLLELFYTYPSELIKEEEPFTLDSLLKGVADAIREKKGTTEKINPKNYKNEILSINSSATINVPGGWKGTPVPNSGHVENVYFNTELSVEEVVKLLEQLDFIEYEPGNPNWSTYSVLGTYVDQYTNNYFFVDRQVDEDNPDNIWYGIFNWANDNIFSTEETEYNMDDGSVIKYIG